MTSFFPDSQLQHIAAQPKLGDAASSIITPEAFSKACAEINSWDGYAPTPLASLKGLATAIGVKEIYYKDEGPRFGLGSFKALGGAYAAQCILQREISAKLGHPVTLPEIRMGHHAHHCASITLVSATDGNHGRSLAWGCQRFGSPCRIYVHAEVSEGRQNAIRDLGAEVLRIKGDYDASVDLAMKDAEENGWFVVSDTSWTGYRQPPLDVMAGYGVMTREICEQLDDVPTHIFLQGGVGGLAAGVAAGLRQYWGKNSPRVIIVEPELAPCLFESGKSGQPTTVTIKQETLMAGLSCGKPSELAWQILAEEVSDFLTIPDRLVEPTMRRLARPTDGDIPIEAGESAVAGLAALIAAMQEDQLSKKLNLGRNSQILLIGSEGVTDREIFNNIMRKRDAA